MRETSLMLFWSGKWYFTQKENEKQRKENKEQTKNSDLMDKFLVNKKKSKSVTCNTLAGIDKQTCRTTVCGLFDP